MDGDFGASVCSDAELAVAAATTWLPPAAASVFGCAGATPAGIDVLLALGSDWLLTDTASGFGCGGGAAIAELADTEPDALLAEVAAGFGCEAGVTTADGTLALAAALSADAEPGGVVPPVDWDMPGAVGLSAVEAVAFWVGPLPVPGDPRPGNTVLSCRLARSGCEAVGREGPACSSG